MPLRKEKFKYPVTKSPSPLVNPEISTISVWWLTNTNVSYYRHLGHYRPVTKEDIEQDLSRVPLRVDYEDIQDTIATFIKDSPDKARPMDDIVNHLIKWCYRYGYYPDERVRATTFYAMDYEDKTQPAFFKLNDENKWTITLEEETKTLKLTVNLDHVSDMQAIIVDTMVKNNGSCTYSQLCEQIGEKWKDLRKPSGYRYCQTLEQAVFSALVCPSTSSIYFKRDVDDLNLWSCSKQAKNALSKARRAGVEIGCNDNDKELNGNSNDIVKNENVLDRSDSKSPNPENALRVSEKEKNLANEMGLTNLQVLMIRSMGTYTNGSNVPIDHIHSYVSNFWGNLKRKDGTNYTIDCRRAILSSLSNNPSVPIFKRDPKDKNLYALAANGVEKFDYINSVLKLVPEQSYKRSAMNPDEILYSPRVRRKKDPSQ